MTLEIRSFNPHIDAQSVLNIIIDDLQKVSILAYTSSQLDKYVQEFSLTKLAALAMVPNRVMLVGVVDSKIVGTASLEGHDVRMVFVDRQCHGKGIGKALIQSIEALALKKGLVQLHVPAATNAVGFYQKCGYEITSEEVSEESGTIVHMKKELTLL